MGTRSGWENPREKVKMKHPNIHTFAGPSTAMDISSWPSDGMLCEHFAAAYHLVEMIRPSRASIVYFYVLEASLTRE